MTIHRPRLLSATLLATATLLAGCATDAVEDPAGDTGAPAGDEPVDAAESDELLGALEEVGRLAPALESFYRGDPYPTELDAVVASLDDADLEVAEGYALGGYRYDPDAVEFTLCVEHTASGAWATYDTAPMSTREHGEQGGCPAL